MKQMSSIDGTAASAFCFGCMQFGGAADRRQSQMMFEACRAAGLNFFDTAHVYTEGASERLLGEFVQSEREKMIVASKVAYTGGSKRTTILGQFEESRSRLGLDTIDVLYLHRWDPNTPLEETFDALRELQGRGQIRYIGVSNFSAWQVMKAQAVAERLGTRIDVLQPMYSLIKRQAEVELLPMALSEGFVVASYSPLGSGLLTGKYRRGEGGRLAQDKRYAARYGEDWMWQTADKLSDLAEEMGHDPASLAVAWVAQNPGVTAPIISACNAAQLKPSLDALALVLSEEDVARIGELSPRPSPATDRLEERLV